MKVKYIAQPDQQLGRILSELLDKEPKRVVFVSAFVGLQTIMRVKDQIGGLKSKGSDIRFVLGIDLGGTSEDVLRELLSWCVDVRIIKHRMPGHTFHPKLYLLEWQNGADIIIGSNNITEGGFFANYEGCARITYELPKDSAQFETALEELHRFVDPGGPTAHALTEGLLEELVERNELPTEAGAREKRLASRKQRQRNSKAGSEKEHLFGDEDIEPPPPLPAALLERLIKNVRRLRKERKKVAETRVERGVPRPQPPVDEKLGDAILPAAFYMTLPTLQGPTIPGEARIPLEAIELAKEFWGWPDEYSKDVSPRLGRERTYWNWRPRWRVWSVEAPEDVAVQHVRMYMYENSSDFRFYVRALVKAGADIGDVIRIQRVAQPEAEYECVLARAGTPEYDQWIKHCTQPVRNSARRFGYA